MKRRRATAKKTWTRIKEVLVVTPEDGLTPAAKQAWARVFKDLSREWRVLWVRAPKRGESVQTGQAGLDPVTVDTLPMIKRVLAEQVVSTVFLVGAPTVEACLESLHSFASHIPYMAVLDEPWRMGKRAPSQLARLEFMVGLADRLILTEEAHRERIEPFLRRLPLEVDVVPAPGNAADYRHFLDRLSGGIQDAYNSTRAALTDKTPPTLAALLPRAEASAMEICLQEWRRSLPAVEDRTFVAPAALTAAARRRLARLWPRSRWLFYRDDQQRIDLLNRSLRGCKTEFALVLTDTARLQPLTLDRLLACGRKLPLVGGITYNRPAEAPPSDWGQWVNFGHAWSLRFNGSYRAVPYLFDDCFLLNRSTMNAVGAFDARLGWRLAARDYCLRLRQAGYNLFIAEDALAFSPPRNHDGVDASFHEMFVSKWNLDPLALAFDGEIGAKTSRHGSPQAIGLKA